MEITSTAAKVSMLDLLGNRLDTSRATKAIMEKLDTNRDGVISEEEKTKAALESMRTNQDANGSLEEIFGQDKSKNQLPKCAADIVCKIMKDLDKNNDGIISAEELLKDPEMAKKLSKADVNKDGNLTIDELTEFFKSLQKEIEAKKELLAYFLSNSKIANNDDDESSSLNFEV